MALVPFNNAKSVGDRFLELLHRNEIDPQQSSKIEDELLSLLHLIEVTKNPDLAEGDNRLKILRMAAGLHDLAAKLLSIETLPDFRNCLDHLRLISKNAPDASIGQLQAGNIFDDTGRKMAELYLGCLAAHCGENVEFDHPSSAKGDNPDIIFRYRGRRWALAIKTISTRQGQTIFERIKDGAIQIDRDSCTADVGMVVINAKDAIDHKALWETVYCDLNEAVAAVGAELDDLVEAACHERPQEEWDELFAGRVARPILLLGQSVVRIRASSGQEVPTPLKMLRMFSAGGANDDTAHEIARALNHFMQTILNGQPGGQSCLPS